MYSFLYILLLLFSSISSTYSSELGATFGDAAVSQILRHTAHQILEEPTMVEVLLKTKSTPALGSLAHLDLLSTVSYSNLSIHFHEQLVNVVVDKFSMISHVNISDFFWPLGLSDQMLDTHVQLSRGEILLNVDETSLKLAGCQMNNAAFNAAVKDHWMADKALSMFTSVLSPVLDHTFCSVIRHYVSKIKMSSELAFPVHQLIPQKLKKFLSSDNTTLFYKLRSIQVSENQLTAKAQLQWQNIIDSPIEALLSANSSLLDIELREDDQVTVWLEDSLVNELLAQVDWNFEWMNEKIPVSSPVIPPDSREFLSTLCDACYFRVNVAARGQPQFSATNNSLVLEKRDRVHLQVVNPDKNVTSVFVSFVLTIQAEIRPSFDDGVMRTLVQLLDTNIVMEAGAFPKHWGLFMQDLMKGMIMDMLWPEIKTSIEDLSYARGVKISNSCGINPNEISVDIGEGNFAVSTRLALHELDLSRCIRELKSSLPSTTKLFPSAANS